ncbi:MAG: FMN-binding glutamate synthase family protein, partial [Limnobacter sp.]|nr:FMN-binding glutamate synthase family protein [Limnobacter sp.]
AKGVIDKKAFGTQRDLYEAGTEWINHSAHPVHITDPNFRVMVGGPDCKQPYSASIFNISAMSFGALSANAILALNEGAKRGGFAHDTGEGAISPYHEQHEGDLIWEIGSGYFGCRTEDGQFDPERFAQNARRSQVKMIEIKLSQGAKPGHGGVLPGSKVTPEIALTRGVPVGVDCVSPSAHRAFTTPLELMSFIGQLRELSGGKPVGIKLCIGHAWEWFSLAKAMYETGCYPDFIVIDGSEGGTGAAPVEFADNVGFPMQEGLRLVHNTLVGLGIREDIRLVAAGKIISAYDIVRTCALGADMCNSARGFMFAIGCIMAQACHTGHCPTGVTTQDKNRQAALVPKEKAVRVFNFHRNTMEALAALLGAAGLTHPMHIKPHHLSRRLDNHKIALFSDNLEWSNPAPYLKAICRAHGSVNFGKGPGLTPFKPQVGCSQSSGDETVGLRTPQFRGTCRASLNLACGSRDRTVRNPQRHRPG